MKCNHKVMLQLTV